MAFRERNCHVLCHRWISPGLRRWYMSHRYDLLLDFVHPIMFNEALRVGSFPLQARNAPDLVDTVHGAVLTAET